MRALSANRAAWSRPASALLALGGFVITSLGCGQSEPRHATHQPASIHARSTDGDDVPGVRVWADGHELGTTDGAGQLVTALVSAQSARVVITAACPPAYRTLDERRELTVRPVHAPPSHPALPPLQLVVICVPLELLTALVVRVRGEPASDLPIRVRGQVVGQTDRDGTAHLLLRTRPNTSLTVELDTSAEPQLEPHDPVQTFQLGEEPSVLVFDRALTRPRPAGRAHRTQPRVASTRGLPYRVD